MSNVINLCLLLMLSRVRFFARVAEFVTVYWLSRFRCCCKILLSLLAVLYEGVFVYVVNYWSDRITVFVKF